MKRNPNFTLREIYGKYILMPIRRNDIASEPIHLNDIAAIIWNQTDDCETSSDLLAAIAELYNLAPESPEQISVKQFIGQLVEMGLISE